MWGDPSVSRSSSRSTLLLYYNAEKSWDRCDESPGASHVAYTLGVCHKTVLTTNNSHPQSKIATNSQISKALVFFCNWPKPFFPFRYHRRRFLHSFALSNEKTLPPSPPPPRLSLVTLYGSAQTNCRSYHQHYIHCPSWYQPHCKMRCLTRDWRVEWTDIVHVGLFLCSWSNEEMSCASINQFASFPSHYTNSHSEEQTIVAMQGGSLSSLCQLPLCPKHTNTQVLWSLSCEHVLHLCFWSCVESAEVQKNFHFLCGNSLSSSPLLWLFFAPSRLKIWLGDWPILPSSHRHGEIHLFGEYVVSSNVSVYIVVVVKIISVRLCLTTMLSIF